MIKYLKLKNFVKHDDLELTFEKGLTAICGANGAGKSLIQEAIRFALFGTQALRGKIENYSSSMQVTLRLCIGGKDYEIVRSLRNCTFDGIVGTTACNKAIEEKLGFGMNVFDMGCCAKQFEITKLGEMKPTERKQAVDKLIGLDKLEVLRKEVKMMVSELKGRLEGLNRYLVEPVEPEKPLMYRPSSEVRSVLEEGRSLKAQLDKDVSTFMVCEQIEPTKPVFDMKKPKGDPSTEQLRKQLERIVSQFVERTDVFTEEELVQVRSDHEKLMRWEPYANLEKPKLTIQEIEVLTKDWEDYKKYTASEKVTCPDCGKVFALGGYKEVEKPTVSETYLREQQSLHMKWAVAPEKPEREYPEGAKELGDKITRSLNYWNLYRGYLEAKTDLENMEPCDYEGWRIYNQAEKEHYAKMSTYDFKLRSYKIGLDLLAKIQTNTDKMKNYDLDTLSKVYDESLRYETLLSTYQVQKEQYERLCSEKEELEKEYNAYKMADEGIVELKSKIKLYVIPSLEKVATELICEMTDYELNTVKISEEFDILVNDKELALLSGSEKAVANLAIRLGLGCVLTHKIFNVFMGDEIDESMSEQRAHKVSESLHKLLGQIEQILLISHKNIEADRYIFI